MPRKQRCRCIEGYPDHWAFSPEELSGKEPVVMTLDEFETIRLLDREGLTQEQCAEKMGIARTTVTAIYDSARRKVADALVEGKQLLIRGGNYRLNDQGAAGIMQKGTDTMRIAVTYENGEIFQHFGHTEQFKLYDVEDGRIVSEQIVPTNGSVTGSADAAAKALAEGTLQYDPNARCDHHDHHHGEGHDCGHHHGEGHDCGHHHGEGHECGHHHGEGLDCGHQEGDEGCRRHHGE